MYVGQLTSKRNVRFSSTRKEQEGQEKILSIKSWKMGRIKSSLILNIEKRLGLSTQIYIRCGKRVSNVSIEFAESDLYNSLTVRFEVFVVDWKKINLQRCTLLTYETIKRISTIMIWCQFTVNKRIDFKDGTRRCLYYLLQRNLSILSSNPTPLSGSNNKLICLLLNTACFHSKVSVN